MTEQDVTPIIHELLAEMAQLRTELNQLKNQAWEIAQPLALTHPSPTVSAARYNTLNNLDLVLLNEGFTANVLETTPMVQTKPATSQTTNGLANHADSRVFPPSAATSSNDNPAVVNAQSENVNGNGLSDTRYDNEGYGVVDNSKGYGLFGPEAIGVYGQGSNYGVYGNSSNVGIYGYSSKIGVYGVGSDSGVFGTGDNVGVAGLGTRVGGIFGAYKGSVKVGSNVGVIGSAGSPLDLNSFDPDTNTGIYGIARGGATNFAGYFAGNVVVTGNLSTASGGFKIDHPLDPTNKYLYHSSVQSPDMLNIYNGMAVLNDQGQVTVEMPDWFEALNSDWRYQLTSIGEAAPDLHILEEIKDRKFIIAGGRPGQKVSWQVTGIRQDAYAKANRTSIEEDKLETQKDKYLHPEVFSHSKVR